MENERTDGDTPAKPFLYVTTRHADFRIADALRFLGNSPGGGEAMERFSERFDDAMDYLCQSIAQEIADTGRYQRRVDIPASAYHARPTYRFDLKTTQRRARRSGSGLWYIYYTIAGTNSGGGAETIVVLSVEHSSAQPYAINTGQFDADVEDDGE